MLLFVGSQSVRIRWYTHVSGAQKFIVQAAVVTSVLVQRPTAPRKSSTVVTSDLRRTLILTSSSLKVDEALKKHNLMRVERQGEWTIVWEGKRRAGTSSTQALLSGLRPDTKYVIRVIAVNALGGKSPPSPCATTTTKRSSEAIASTPGNSASLFTIDCTGDVVVGDFIRFVERVYSLHDDGQRVRHRYGRRRPPSIDHDNDDDDPHLMGKYIGERTVAATIIAEENEGADIDDDNGRRLVLEVGWSTVSKPSIAR